ncbi:GRXC8 [Linum perenne]
MTAANSFTMITNNGPESDSLGGMEHHHSITIRDHNKKKPTTTTTTTSSSAYEVVREVARSNAVVVFSMSGCCMCTVVKRLLFGLGVGPTVVELDQLLPSSTGGAPHEIEDVLFRLQASSSDGGQHNPPVPAVFIGGKFLGGIETLMACHINGSLVPLLKDAGALWL